MSDWLLIALALALFLASWGLIRALPALQDKRRQS